jgi:hypothetical protein
LEEGQMDEVAVAKKWIFLGNVPLLKNMFDPIKNIPLFPKPSGGLWICPYNNKRKFKSDWQKWCYDINFRNYKSGTILTLSKNIRPYIIDSQQNLIELIDEVGSSPECDLFPYWKIIDFERAAERYDLIYLTEKGQGETRLPWKNREYNLYSWDVCCGLLLNYKIRSQKPIKLSFSLEESKITQIDFLDLQQRAEF